MVTIELFGTARLRAGTGRATVPAGRLGDALRSLAALLPSLDETILLGDAVHPAYRLSLNGARFVTDPDTPLADGDCLLLISADAGG